MCLQTTIKSKINHFQLNSIIIVLIIWQEYKYKQNTDLNLHIQRKAAFLHLNEIAAFKNQHFAFYFFIFKWIQCNDLDFRFNKTNGQFIYYWIESDTTLMGYLNKSIVLFFSRSKKILNWENNKFISIFENALFRCNLLEW